MKRIISLILMAGPLGVLCSWESVSAQIPAHVLEETITVIGSDDAFSKGSSSQEEESEPSGLGNELGDLFASGEFEQLRSSLLGGLLGDLGLGGLGSGLGSNGLLNGLPLDLGGLLGNSSSQLGEITRVLNLNNTLGGLLRGL